MMALQPREVEFHSVWNELKVTVGDVMKLNHIPKPDWNDCFMKIYQLCVAHPESFADDLYEATKSFLVNHLEEIYAQLTAASTSPDFLNIYYRKWDTYQQGINYLQSLFVYLNSQIKSRRKYCQAEYLYGSVDDDSKDLMDMGELGMELWKKEVLVPMENIVVPKILECVRADRLGEPTLVEESVINGLIESYVNVQAYRPNKRHELYKPMVEVKYEQASREHFHALSCEWLRVYSISEYMEKVLVFMEEEARRTQRFLDSSSRLVMQKCCQDCMVRDHLSYLLDQSKDLIKDERVEDMANMYMLLRLVPEGFTTFVSQYRRHIEADGLSVMSDLEDSDQIHAAFVDSLLQLHKKYLKQINILFKADPVFAAALDRACSAITNYKFSQTNMNGPSDLLAKYIDQAMKKLGRQLTERELDEKLNEAIEVFKYIEDKDIFHKFYSRNLARRLMNPATMSLESEESMVNKLKNACGFDFTSKLQRMLTDVKVSEDLNKEFQATSERTPLFHFTVLVLQQGAWPMHIPTGVPLLPVASEITNSMLMFELFYCKKFNGRKLTWLHHFSNVEVRLSYLDKPFFLTMQTFQVTILSAFEKVDYFTCADLCSEMQFGPEHFEFLAKNLKPLVDIGVIISSDQVLKEDTLLTLNMSFVTPRNRMRVKNAVQKDCLPEAPQAVNSVVEEDRRMFLQATIVRIMKSRKILNHAQLVSEVEAQCDATFIPTKAVIKSTIEMLIEKQYLERVPNRNDEYTYVA